MARRARIKSASNIYHVVLRGIDRQIIFESDDDFLTFTEILKYYKEKVHFELYAYCLMDNHVHLLIKEGDEDISKTMKRIEVKFARWYNIKYQRVGYLFQDRYRSEPVEDLKYFKNACRYIHQNPMWAGLENAPGKWKWSSIYAYMNEDDSWIDVELMFSQFESPKKCMEFMHTVAKDRLLENILPKQMTDEEVFAFIKEYVGVDSHYDFQKMDIQKRNEIVRELAGYGLTQRQLSRLTGISRTKIGKIAKGDT